jgi:hypothetical protein
VEVVFVLYLYYEADTKKLGGRKNEEERRTNHGGSRSNHEADRIMNAKAITY